MMTQEPEESNRKKFSNWLQGVHSLNLTKTAFHEYVLERWKKEVLSWKKDIPNMKDTIPIFLTCVANKKIKLVYVKDDNSPDKKTNKRKWECVCDHRDVCKLILDKILALQHNPSFNIIWSSNICENLSEEMKKETLHIGLENVSENIQRASTEGLKTSIFNFFRDWFTAGTSAKTDIVEYNDIFDGCKQSHIWCIANMFMQRGKAKTNISNSGPGDTDASMFFKMMKNCKLFEIENEDYLYDDVIMCRDKLHHSANSRVCRQETETYLEKMITLLERFGDVQACKEAIDNIETMLQETVMSMAVKTETISKLAKEALEIKKSALETDEEFTKTSGFQSSSEETRVLLKDTAEALDVVSDPSTESDVFQVFKSREDYKKENEMLCKNKQAEVVKSESSEDFDNPQNMTNDHNDETTNEKSREKFASYAKILASADPDPQLCAAITRHLVPMVNKVAEKDEEIKKKVDEVAIQEMEDENSEVPEESDNTEGAGEPLSSALFEGIDSDIQVCKLRVSENVQKHQFLTCCRISPHELLVADRTNKKVYKLNNQYKLIKWLNLDDWPFDVCYIEEKDISVLLFVGKLVFMDVKDDMKLTKSVEIKHSCSGLLCHSDQLYMIDEKCVYTYNLDGVFQRLLFKNASLKSGFRHIAISKDNGLIYLACLFNGLITIDMCGKLVGTYLDSNIKDAWGVCIDFAGNVLVCGSTSQHILKISSDGRKKIDFIENESKDDGKVTVLFFDKETGLLLTTGSSGNINVLKLQ